MSALPSPLKSPEPMAVAWFQNLTVRPGDTDPKLWILPAPAMPAPHRWGSLQTARALIEAAAANAAGAPIPCQNRTVVVLSAAPAIGTSPPTKARLESIAAVR